MYVLIYIYIDIWIETKKEREREREKKETEGVSSLSSISQIYSDLPTCLHACMHSYTPCAYTHTGIHTYTQHTHTHIHIYLPTYTRACIHTQINTYNIVQNINHILCTPGTVIEFTCEP